MIIPSLKTGKYEEIENRINKSENIYENKSIKSKNEKWLTC